MSKKLLLVGLAMVLLLGFTSQAQAADLTVINYYGRFWTDTGAFWGGLPGWNNNFLYGQGPPREEQIPWPKARIRLRTGTGLFKCAPFPGTLAVAG